MSYAYTAEQPAAVADTTPDGWPLYWPIDLSGIVWPPGWPVAASGYTLPVAAPATITVGAPSAIEATTLAGGLDTDGLLNHIVQVSAAIGSTVVQVKKLPGDAYANSILYQVSNYSGSEYGLLQNIYFDLDAGDVGGTLTVTCTVVSVTPNVTGTDTATVAAAPVGVAPSITGHPVNVTDAKVWTVAGWTLPSKNFTVTATGTAPLTYQWRRNGSSIVGATGSVYTFNMDWSDDGDSFDCVVTNAFGTATSNTATATVTSASIPWNRWITYSRNEYSAAYPAAGAYSLPNTGYVGKFWSGALMGRHRTFKQSSPAAFIPNKTIVSASLNQGNGSLDESLEALGTIKCYLATGAGTVYASYNTAGLTLLGTSNAVAGAFAITLNAAALNLNLGAELRVLLVGTTEDAGGGAGSGGPNTGAIVLAGTSLLTLNY